MKYYADVIGCQPLLITQSGSGWRAYWHYTNVYGATSDWFPTLAHAKREASASYKHERKRLNLDYTKRVTWKQLCGDSKTNCVQEGESKQKEQSK